MKKENHMKEGKKLSNSRRINYQQLQTLLNLKGTYMLT